MFCNYTRVSIIGEVVMFAAMHAQLAACVLCFSSNRGRDLGAFNLAPPPNAQDLLFSTSSADGSGGGVGGGGGVQYAPPRALSGGGTAGGTSAGGGSTGGGGSGLHKSTSVTRTFSGSSLSIEHPTNGGDGGGIGGRRARSGSRGGAGGGERCDGLGPLRTFLPAGPSSGGGGLVRRANTYAGHEAAAASPPKRGLRGKEGGFSGRGLTGFE